MALVLPNPQSNVDPASFGNVSKDPKAMKKYLKAYTKDYTNRYIREFLQANRFSENRFPQDLLPIMNNAIDQVPDNAVLNASNENAQALKKQLDTIAKRMYPDDELNPSNSTGSERATRTLEKKFREGESAVRQYISDLDNRLKQMESKVAKLEAVITEQSGQSPGVSILDDGIIEAKSAKTISYISLAIAGLAFLLLLFPAKK